MRSTKKRLKKERKLASRAVRLLKQQDQPAEPPTQSAPLRWWLSDGVYNVREYRTRKREAPSQDEKRRWRHENYKR